jgi:hypothetical protein
MAKIEPIRVDVTVAVRTERGTVHMCPPDGSGIMPCCRKTPFEAARITLDPKKVTCNERLQRHFDGCPHAASEWWLEDES